MLAAPHKEAVLISDFDDGDGGVVGVAELAVAVDVGQQLAGILFLGIDECGREDVEDFIVLAVGPGQVQKLAMYSADVQVDIDADSAAGKLVEK